MFYSFLKWFIRTALRIYFRDIAIEGVKNIPPDTPVIFTSNHQNAFLDALIVGAFCPNALHFITRSDVFTWWSKPILRAMHMIPIYRIRDGYGKLSENEHVFSNCGDLLRSGKSILIFAEGNHGEHYYLRPLTKGAARLAIQSQLIMDRKLVVVPVGLNYFSHRHPNTKVIMAFGEPIDIQSLEMDSSPKNLIRLKEMISNGMKETLAIPEESENYAAFKESVFNEENIGLSLAELRAIQPQLKKRSSSLPSHLFAKLLNPIPFLIIAMVLSRVEDIVFHGSLKFSLGLVLFPLYWIIVFLIFSMLVGIIPAIGIVAIMITTLMISYKW